VQRPGAAATSIRRTGLPADAGRETRVSEPRHAEDPDDRWREEYWRRNLRLMAILLVIWFTVSFGFGILLVEQLNRIEIAGFPLGFWFAQQGSIYVFVVLILVYAKRMDRLDIEFGVDERDQNGDRL
jgi:putative solute:sodium symporter small subunit